MNWFKGVSDFLIGLFNKKKDKGQIAQSEPEAPLNQGVSKDPLAKQPNTRLNKFGQPESFIEPRTEPKVEPKIEVPKVETPRIEPKVAKVERQKYNPRKQAEPIKYTNPRQQAAEAAKRRREEEARVQRQTVKKNLEDDRLKTGFSAHVGSILTSKPEEQYRFGKDLASGTHGVFSGNTYSDILKNYNALDGDKQADVREHIQTLQAKYELNERPEETFILTSLNQLLNDKNYTETKKTSFLRDFHKTASTGGFVGRGAQAIADIFNAVGNLAPWRDKKEIDRTNKNREFQRRKLAIDQSNTGSFGVLDQGMGLVGNLVLNMETGGAVGALQSLGQIDAATQRMDDKVLALDENSKPIMRNRTDGEKVGDVGQATMANLWTILGLKGIGPSINGTGELGRATMNNVLKYLRQEAGYAGLTTGSQAFFQHLSGEEVSLGSFVKQFANNFVQDLANDVASYKTGRTQNNVQNTIDKYASELAVLNKLNDVKVDDAVKALTKAGVDEAIAQRTVERAKTMSNDEIALRQREIREAKLKDGSEPVLKNRASKITKNIVPNEQKMAFSEDFRNDYLAKLRERQQNPTNEVKRDGSERYTREAVAKDLFSIVNKQDFTTAVNQLKAKGENAPTAQEIRQVLDRTNNMEGANNKLGVFISDLRRLRAGQNSDGTEQPKGPTLEQYQKMTDDFNAKYNSGGQELLLNSPDEPVRQETQERLTPAQAKYNRLVETAKSFGELPTDLIRKVQEANRNSTDLELTPAELEVWNKVLPNFGIDPAQALATKYLPQQYADSDYASRAVSELLNTGRLEDVYKRHRTNAINLDEMDYSMNPLIDYFVRGQNPDVNIKLAAEQEAIKLNPQATDKQLKIYSETIANVAKQIDEVKDTEIYRSKINIADEMGKAGDALSLVKDVRTNKLHGLSDDVRDASLGLKDFVDVSGFSPRAIASNSTDEQIIDYINELPYVDKSHFTLDTIVNKYNGLIKALAGTAEPTAEVAKYADIMAREAVLKDALKQNIFNGSKVITFTDPSAQAYYNKRLNEVLLSDRHLNSTIMNAVQLLNRWRNASFRGGRWQTTLNEIAEISKLISTYQEFTQLAKPGEWNGILTRYGINRSGVFDSLPAETQKQIGIAVNGADPETALKNLWNLAKKAGNAVDKVMQWNEIIQDFKDASFIKSAEAYHANMPNGIEKTKTILKEFTDNMLPQDRYYKILKSDAALAKALLMYVDAGVRMGRQFVRGISGETAGGKYDNGTRVQNIARYMAGDLGPRAIVAMVRGVPLWSVLNIPNLFTGEDFSNIPKEEQTIYDQFIITLSRLSPTTSDFAQPYFNARVDAIEEQRAKETGYSKGERIDGDWLERSLNNLKQNLTPYGSFLNQIFGYGDQRGGAIGLNKKGYRENPYGRVQYEAPDNAVDHARNFIEGSSGTGNAREYNKRHDLLSAISETLKAGDGLVGFFNRFIKQNEFFAPFGLKDNTYNRPLTNSESAPYNSTYKDLMSKGQRELAHQLFTNGKRYNAIIDKVRQENLEMYNHFISAMDGNHVNPEYWREMIGGNANGNIDLTNFHMLRDRKKQAYKDFGTPYDPIYDLTDEQARAVLQQKSVATGDDFDLRNNLYKTEWYVEYMDKVKNYWDSKEDTDYDDARNTERVKEWYRLNDTLNAFNPNAKNFNQELVTQFPLVYAQKQIDEQFGYGSEQSSNFYRQYGNQYKEQKEKYELARLEVINAMRKIEDFPPLTANQWKQVNNANTEKKSSSYGGSRGQYDYLGELYNTLNFAYSEPKQKTKVRKFKSPKIAKGHNRRIEMQD